MSYETEVAALTVAVNTVSSLVQTLDTTTQSAYNVAVATAQTHAGTALTQANIAITQAALATSNGAAQVTLATTQKTLATTQATNAATSATTATTQAGIATTQAAAATAAAVGASNIVLGVSTLYPAIRPSLDLDFANGQTVDPRITFTRASTATRTNSKGLIELVPSGVPRIDFDPITGACKGLLIEEQRTNLLTYSEQFDNAAWVKTRATVTANATTAPDGTLTADKLVEDSTASNNHYFEQNATATAANPHTFTVFVKPDSRTYVNFRILEGSPFARSTNVNFDFLSATVGTKTDAGGASASSASIVSVGGGWFKCSLTTTLGGSATSILAGVFISSAGGTSYTGDGTSGLFIWGAQLEAGAFPTSYQPSTETFTGRASTATFFGSNGLIQTASSGAARLNYNPTNLTVAPKLLLEAAGTNLIWPSVPDATWYSGAGVALTHNDSASPDGTVTATKVSSLADLGTYKTVTISSGVIHCHSFYLKNSTAVRLLARDDTGSGRHIVIDPVAGVITGTSGAILGYGSVPCGNGYTRYWFSFMSDSTNSRCTVRNDVTATTVLFWIWGAQLEANAFPTSYIPTVASQVTRAADTSTSAQTTRAADVASMTGANFSSWYRQDEGSFVVSAIVTLSGSSFPVLADVCDGTASNIIYVSARSSTSQGRMEALAGGVSQVASSSGSIVSGAAFTESVAYKANDYALSVSGGAVVADAAATVPTVTKLDIGCERGASNAINGCIRSLSYYPKRLTNAELQALSTQ